MLTKILILLALAFLVLGAFRWVTTPPRPRWVIPAMVGAVVSVLLFRLGTFGLLAGAAVAAALWYLPRPRTAPRRDMAAAEARAVLGVSVDANAADIRAAHRARIASAHPDRGGSADVAARLNAARDVLLKEKAKGTPDTRG